MFARRADRIRPSPTQKSTSVFISMRLSLSPSTIRTRTNLLSQPLLIVLQNVEIYKELSKGYSPNYAILLMLLYAKFFQNGVLCDINYYLLVLSLFLSFGFPFSLFFVFIFNPN